MANGDLESWVEARYELPEEFLSVVAYQVCRALALLHENKRMHRDVKPGNVRGRAREGLQRLSWGFMMLR